jgi:hypothetical protein
MKLTERNTPGLKLETGKSDWIWWDDDITGFGIRVRAGGSRNWIYRYRIGSKQRSLILGSAKSVPLSLARQNASKLEARVRLGEDPALDRQTAKLEVDNTFGVLAHRYLETRKSEWRPVTYKEVERHLKKYAKSLHRLPITAVSQHNIASLLNTLAKDVGNVTANRVRGSLCSLFGWVIREGIRLPEGNVASYTNKRQERARDRVLSDEELRAIWKVCPDDDYGAILKLLMLTAQRANEIAELRWDEVHDEQIVLPVRYRLPGLGRCQANPQLTNCREAFGPLDATRFTENRRDAHGRARRAAAHYRSRSQSRLGPQGRRRRHL